MGSLALEQKGRVQLQMIEINRRQPRPLATIVKTQSPRKLVQLQKLVLPHLPALLGS